MTIDLSPDALRDRLRNRLFGTKVIQNNFRGELVEEIVRSALGSDWQHCSNDWHAWDFQNKRVRIQVKQAAARQSWDNPGEDLVRKRTGVFPISPKSGYYKGNEWFSTKLRRHAELYILCWHGDDSSMADHFDLSQWEFFVLPAAKIPEPKNAISVRELREMQEAGMIGASRYTELRAVVNAAEANVDTHDADALEWRDES